MPCSQLSYRLFAWCCLVMVLDASVFGQAPATIPSGANPSPVPVNNTATPLPSTSPIAASPSPTASQPSIPSLENRQPVRSMVEAPKAVSDVKLPNNAGQQWVEYDIRAYTQTVKNSERPQQAILDWILRETGTDSWFGEPMGILTADKNTLRVYHTASMQKKVAQLYERFVNGVAEPQVFGLRIIQVSNPQWRSRAFGLMRSTPCSSTGVQAWLMPKENGAILLAQLRERNDAKELQAVEIPLYNGQLQALEQLRSRNYLKEYVRNQTAAFPPFQPVSEEIKEGFRLQISTLMNLDSRSADLMLKCEIDQVERLNQVRIDLPVGGSQTQQTMIEVPQIVSWRLQERLSWPTDQILLLSCGIVASANAQVDNTLLNSPPTLFGLNRVLPTLGQRTDALLWLEYRGPLSTQISATPIPSAQAATPAPSASSFPTTSSTNNLSRGRY